MRRAGEDPGPAVSAQRGGRPRGDRVAAGHWRGEGCPGLLEAAAHRPLLGRRALGPASGGGKSLQTQTATEKSPGSPRGDSAWAEGFLRGTEGGGEREVGPDTHPRQDVPRPAWLQPAHCRSQDGTCPVVTP